MTDRVPSLPATYDPDVIHEILSGLLAVPAATAQEAPVELPTRIARSDAQTMMVRTNAATYANLGTLDDPRLGSVTVSREGKVVDGRQRFRFVEGVKMNPIIAPPDNVFGWAWGAPGWLGAAASICGIPFGVVVPKIPHALGRIPERVVMRASCDDRGPLGQRVKASWTASPVRCDVDFLPILGQTADDVEDALKHFLFFTGSSRWSMDDLVGTVFGSTVIDSRSFARSIAAELVTTEEHFGGILLGTTWGLGAYQAAEQQYNSAVGFVAHQRIAGTTRNGVSGQRDAHVSAPIPELGKDLFAAAMQIVFGTPALQTAYSSGLQVTLDRGSVDFVLE